MFVPLLVILAAPLAMGQFGDPFGQLARKPGSCPPYPNVRICEFQCYVDVHCPGNQKCCRTACGGSFCISPVTMAPVSLKEKAGSCPNPPTGPWVCSSRCAQDSDCRGKKKCCKNRCGAQACVAPQEDEDNDIPTLI